MWLILVLGEVGFGDLELCGWLRFRMLLNLVPCCWIWYWACRIWCLVRLDLVLNEVGFGGWYGWIWARCGWIWWCRVRLDLML